MAINSYAKGALVRVAAAFVDAAGGAIDPATVTIKHRSPNGTVAVKTWAAGEVIRDSLGNFHFDIDANAAGAWHYRWESTGAGQAAAEGQFSIDNSALD